MSGQDKDKALAETSTVEVDDSDLNTHPIDRSQLDRKTNYEHNKNFPQGDHPFDKQYADSDDAFISDIVSSENLSSDDYNSDLSPGSTSSVDYNNDISPSSLSPESYNSDIMPGSAGGSPAFGPEETSSIVQSGGSGTGIIEPGYGGIVEPPGDDPHEGEGKVMSVIDHLDELRVRLVRCLIAFGLAMSVTFTYGKQIIQFLEKPAGNMTFQALSIEEPLFVYCKVAFYGALIIAAPYLLYEICGFVAPGLKKNERRMLSPIVIGGPLLFVTGAAFCYYCVLPPMLSFFTSFGVGISPVQQRLDFYISLVTTMLFYLGLCFQLPIVLFALSLAGIVNSKQLLGWWRHAMVGSSVAAAIITPDPTVVSMLIVTVALIGLYFFTVALLKVFGR